MGGGWVAWENRTSRLINFLHSPPTCTQTHTHHSSTCLLHHDKWFKMSQHFSVSFALRKGDSYLANDFKYKNIICLEPL